MDILAAGDIINIIVADPSNIYYQPAAGVEIIITAGVTDNSYHIGLYDGTNTGQNANCSTLPPSAALNMKFGITNTNYAKIYSSASHKGFTGIQTK